MQQSPMVKSDGNDEDKAVASTNEIPADRQSTTPPSPVGGGDGAGAGDRGGGGDGTTEGDGEDLSPIPSADNDAATSNADTSNEKPIDASIDGEETKPELEETA